MLLTGDNIIKLLPILRFELYNRDTGFLVPTNAFPAILSFFKNHFKYQFKVLTSISGVDYPDNLYRFQIVYELLSIKFNARTRIKILVDELSPLNSVEKIFPAATWYECEVFDMYGVFFLDQDNLTRLLTDYGFQGYPLRKDFPLSGFTEAKYNVTKNRVVYENVELAQEYRTFEFISPWEDFTKK